MALDVDMAGPEAGSQKEHTKDGSEVRERESAQMRTAFTGSAAVSWAVLALSREGRPCSWRSQATNLAGARHAGARLRSKQTLQLVNESS
jgi:hypothetical protein